MQLEQQKIEKILTEDSLVFRIIQFGLERREFTKQELYLALKLDAKDEFYLDYIILMDKKLPSTPNHIIVRVEEANSNQQDWKLRLLPNAIFQYVDYLEIREARKTSQEAKKLSWIAIGVTVILTIVQIWVQVKS